MDRIEKTIARKVHEKGGRVFYVGGFVRDGILGIESKDIDVEVHGISSSELLTILKEIGEPLSYGNSFGVYSLKGYDIDIAMPRLEHATGSGHKDFEIFVDPFIGAKKAARRRDFTINAMMQDVLTGEIIDYYDGRYDLSRKVLRHVDAESFVEDPLRVLRAAQFAARYELTIDSETKRLCENTDISSLSKERVEGELKKALIKALKPSIFFETLRRMKKLSFWFPELEKLIGIEQDPKFHPEGDVWIHTMEVLDRAASFRQDVQDPYSFMLLALTHDFGKITTTEEIDGHIHAYEHETKGLPVIEEFLNRIVSENTVKDYVLNMVPLHMKPNVLAFNKSSLKKTNKMFDEAVSPKDLVYFAMCDRPVKSGDVPFEGDDAFLFDRYKKYEEIMSRPHVMGRDLLAAGLQAGEYFNDLLTYAHKLHLAGINKDNALKQTLAYARTNKNNDETNDKTE